MQKLKPALQSSEGRSKPWSGARLLNCYAEKADGDKRDDFAVMAMPGLDVDYTVGTGPIRGAVMMGDLLYVVSGTSLYSLDESGTSILIGGIPGIGLVQMVTNGTQIAVCAAPSGFVYSGGALTTPANLPAVGSVTFIDGYFVWTSFYYDQFVISDPVDGTVYAGDVATVEGAPDGLRGVIADHRELLFVGERTIEIWYNSGAPDFPFERQGNAFIERGCADRDSIVKIDNGVHFVGDDLIVYRLEGYQPVRISTHSVEYWLASASWFRAFTFTLEGHKFYVLNTDVGTHVFDMATGLWHERASWRRPNWRCCSVVSAWGRVLLFDDELGRLFSMSFDTFTEAGDVLAVEISLPTLESGDRERRSMDAFELLCETGVGNDDVATPQAMLTYSDDGGRTWSNELWRSLGAVGTYRTRAIWRKLGMFRQRQIKLRLTDAARRFVLGYYVDIS